MARSRNAAPGTTPSGSLPLSEFLESKHSRAMASFAVRDLATMIRFRPRRYLTPVPLRSLRDVREGDEMSAIVTVESVRDRRMRRQAGSILEAVVSDGRDTLTLTFFLPRQHMVDWHCSRLTPGTTIHVRGVAGYHRGVPQLTHPEYDEVDDTPEARERAQRPLPVYPLKKKIKQSTMREATEKGLEYLHTLQSPIPEAVIAARGLLPPAEAARALHYPREIQDAHAGQRHFAYEEALVLQTIFAQRRAQDAATPAPALTAEGPLQGALAAQLPFPLTDGQQGVISQIHELVARDHPTSVLLQGDVGSGKTVVALMAMLRAVDSGHQAALLAPTEVLAEQHHRTITTLLGDLAAAGQLHAHPDATRVRLLTGSQRTSARRETMLDATSGEAGIIIGTHALLTESVEFASLGLVVIDEQHRFGVDHRRRLRAKGPGGMSPHVVVMTATPIPRTAALTAVGDLDVLTLRERPGMRAGVQSFVVLESNMPWMQRMWERAAEEIAAGRQVFVVCPHIEETVTDPPPGEDPSPPPRGVMETAERLSRVPQLAGARIGILHGRLGAEEKQQVMAQMNAGDLDILVATTVIEVGVDIPNASVMMILDAECFGVSQLHQLRGRVGRGEHPGIAFLVSRLDAEHEAAERLRQIAGAADGFALAELDLQRRGAGDLVGTEQSGLASALAFLDVLTHRDLIEMAREDARAIIAEDPALTDHRVLASFVEQRLRAAEAEDVERS